MSSFENRRATADAEAGAAAEALERLAASGGLATLSVESLQRVVGAAVNLYARTCEAAGAQIVPVGAGVATTEAVVLACALVRAQSLTPFDFALWFSHTAPRTEVTPVEAQGRGPHG
jgi:hypothetical protein